METKNLKQTITFNGTPQEVYDLIMDAKKHGEMSMSKVSMSKKVNGKFRVFDGYCHGYNIELEEGKKIVQAWHFAEDGWPDDHYSTCTFIFKKEGKKTKLSFTQSDIPAHKLNNLKDGWKQFYWNPMKAYLNG